MNRPDYKLSDSVPAATPQRKKRCLVVRPVKPEAAHGGDEIVYRRSIEYLSRTMDIEICELQASAEPTSFLELFKGTPPEITRFSRRGKS